MKSKISGLETVHNADFTSLLDVVMILLFIIMVRQADSYKQAEREVREQTEAQVAEMQRKIDKYENDAKDARTENENLRSIAEGKNAVKEYVTLINISVYSAYNERKILISGDSAGGAYTEISITKGTEERALRTLRDDLGAVLDDTGGGITVIVFSYNSKNAYRQDIINISSVIGEIQREYDDVYLREKNTAEERN